MKWTVLILFVVAGCAAGREAVMPFKNLGYSGERIFPVKTSSAEYSLRIWVNNSTSIDRIISISKDSLEDYTGYLTEIGVLINGKKSTQYYKQIKITPKSGFEVFRNKADSINFLDLATQSELLPTPLHQPFSTYVIEFKNHNQFNTFQFDSYYPYKGKINDQYAAIEKLVFEEFEIKQYFKFPK